MLPRRVYPNYLELTTGDLLSPTGLRPMSKTNALPEQPTSPAVPATRLLPIPLNAASWHDRSGTTQVVDLTAETSTTGSAHDDSERDDFNRHLAIVQADYDQLRKKLRTTADQLTLLRSKYDAKQGEVNHLQSQLEQKNRDIQAVYVELNNTEQELTEAEQELAALDDHIDVLNAMVAEKTNNPLVRWRDLTWSHPAVALGIGVAVGVLVTMGLYAQKPRTEVVVAQPGQVVTTLPESTFSTMPCEPKQFVLMLSTALPPETLESGDLGSYVQYQSARRKVREASGEQNLVKLSQLEKMCPHARAQHTKATDPSVRIVWAGPFATKAAASSWQAEMGFSTKKTVILPTAP